MGEASASSGISAGASDAAAGQPALRRNALGLRHAIVISVAAISPAASVFFNTVPQASQAGAAITFCTIIGFIVALFVANQYSEFSREIPSSGSAYTFVLEGLGARWAFLTGWIGLIALVLSVPYAFVFMSANLQTLMQRWFGLSLPWAAYYIVAIGVVFALCYIGIRGSLRVDLTLLIFEMGVCVALAVIVLTRVGGQGGLSLTPLNPAVAPSGGGLVIGVLLGVLNFIGFETAAALGEETRSPRRNIPRAIYGSLFIIGVFYVVMTYAATMGYGVSHMVTGYGSELAPFDTIARRFGGGALVALIDVAGILSFFGATLAIVNGGARIIFTLARDGMFPRPLGWAHPTRGTPGGAITLLCGLGLIAGLGLNLIMAPIVAFSFLATLDALFVLLIYLLVSISCIRFFWVKRRAQFSVARHAVIPALGALITSGIAVLALVSPETGPQVAVPFVVLGWLALGGIVLLVLRGKISAPSVVAELAEAPEASATSASGSSGL